MNAIFDPNSLSESINDFVEKLPRILQKDPLTVDLAHRVERLVDFSETPFTLAVMGQMRGGKSTLINALVGEDLAPVGVNETTATINYFKFGDDQLKNICRVHWKDKPYQDFNHSEINKWLGESEHASNTKFIEFFSDTKFLKKIYIVDTPGTRSVIEPHEMVIDDFLVEKRERETLRCGGRADAILYVMGPVARETDRSLLDKFENTTRVDGSSPFNSMAVVHKWETLDENDPWSAAKDKASLIANQLKDYMSTVIPVSGPFARLSSRHPKEFWNQLAKFFFSITKDEKAKHYLDKGREHRFKAISQEGADLLERSELPWVCYKALWKIARNNGYPDGPTLHSLIQKVSGMDNLSKLLKERFIDRTRLVKSFTLLAKAMDSFETARIKLNIDIKEKRKQINRLKDSQASLKAALEGGASYLSRVYEHLNELRVPIENSIQNSTQIKKQVETLSRDIRENHDNMHRDLKALSIIDQNGFKFDDKEAFEIRSILGCYGYSLSERIACYAKNGNPVRDQIKNRIEYFHGAAVCSVGIQKKVYEQIVNRLETIDGALRQKRTDR
jgi:hypothetical protein